MTTRSRPATPAYEQIRQAIVEGVYAPGQRLIEQRIAEELELSRTPVREALHRLVAEGLVQSEPNRGAVVRALSVEDIADIYGLRARLEGYAAELAAQRAGEEDIAAIDEGITAFAAALARPAHDLEVVRQTHEANRRIHDAILSAAKHDRLSQALGRTIDVPLVFQAFREFDRAETERSHLFHTVIRDAIVAGDAVRAGNLMSEHVLQGRDALIAHVQARAEEEG
ncbi:MAG TPA: GntR family transcriptional regulator [Marmoricola sp.]|jgi:DNA-binding GntR family transcriptional regulator|nr:GntR family transcriptional regulator [Marmoricola sp.]